MDNETRNTVRETFNNLDKMLSQPRSAESLVPPEVMELLGNAKHCLHVFDDENFEFHQNEDFRLDIQKAIEAIENGQSDDIERKTREEWLNKARERIRKVNDDLKGWAD